MSEELVKRLRKGDEFERFMLAERAADRIEELEAVVGRQHKRAETLAEGWRIADDARIELEAKLAKVVEAGVDVAASLNAAISLLERGGKKAAPSDKMFAQILVDYSASLDRFRTTLAELTGGKDD